MVNHINLMFIILIIAIIIKSVIINI